MIGLCCNLLIGDCIRRTDSEFVVFLVLFGCTDLVYSYSGYRQPAWRHQSRTAAESYKPLSVTPRIITGFHTSV
jgi:hypothetical protein